MIELLQEIEASRGVPVELMCAALEDALATAYRQHAGNVDVRVEIDRATATPAIWRRRVVVDEVREPSLEIARDATPAGYEPGDFYDDQVQVGDFGRLAALTALRVIKQRVVEFERERVFAFYRPLQGTIVRGLVQRVIRGAVYVVFEDGNEGVLPVNETSPREHYAINDYVDAELVAVLKTKRGPALILSRARESFVRKLFDSPAIVGGARRVGYVTALVATSPLDPTAIANVRAQIGGERIQVIDFGPPEHLVAQLMPVGVVDVFPLPEHGLIIAESEDPPTPLQLQLASEICGLPVVGAEIGRSDEVLEEALAAIAAMAPPPTVAEVDEDLRRRLEEYARERSEIEDDEEERA